MPIYEFWKDREGAKDNRMNSMSEDEIRMVDHFSTLIEQRRGDMNELSTRIEKEQEAYSGDQEIIDNRPNSRVNIINANIEGQVAALVEQNIAVKCRGEGPSDQSFARWGEIGLDWTLRKNHIKRILERHERRRELFGWAWLKASWDPDAINGFGLATITCPAPNAVFVDGKIYDPLNIESAEYIAEVMPKSKAYAKEKYPDQWENIIYGGTDRASVFAKETTTDDEDLFWLIPLWTKTDGILRLIEFSDDGILLYDSFKDKNKGEGVPFYSHNKYPYFLTNLYYEEGKLYGFGDGKLLRPLQDMINDLYDQIRRAARPNRIFFDEQSEVDLDDLDEDDGPVPCQDPNGTIRVVEVGKVNPAMWQLLSNIHAEVQRVTRFSELMMGQTGRGKTATEASIQQQQGNSATDHKKLMLQETLIEVCEYLLSLMMENYTEARAFRIDEDKDDYEWIDYRQLNKIPYLVPTDDEFATAYKQNNPDAETPKWMQLMDDQNEGVTKSVDLDIDINIGAGLPKNKAFLWQMVESLSKVVVEGRSILSWAEFRSFIEKFVGIPLEDDQMALQQQMPGQMAPGAPGAPPVAPMPNANTPGLSAGGSPQMSALPPAQGVA